MAILHVQSPTSIQAPNGSTLALAPSASLVLRGPLIQVTVGLAQSVAQQLLQQGAQVPPSITGSALLDTGATSTCIDEFLAQQLGLPVVDIVSIASASHAATQQRMYPARFEIAGLTTVDVPRAIGAVLGAQGIVALIGRDVLAHLTVFYNGPAGQFTLAR